MKVRCDLRVPGSADITQRLDRTLLNGDLIGREIRRAHAQAGEETREPRELADILDRHAVPAAVPVIFFGVQGDDDHDAVRARAATFTHRPTLPRPRLAWSGLGTGLATRRPRPARAATAHPSRGGRS